MRDLRRYAVANARLRALRSTLLGVRGLDALYSYPTAATMGEALGRTAYGYVPRQRLAAVALVLVANLDGPRRDLVIAYVRRLEVENIQLSLRVVAENLPAAVAAGALATELGALGSVEAGWLQGVRDLRDAVDRLQTSIYGAPLRAALPRVEQVGVFALELALELDFHERLWEQTASLSGRDRGVARRLLGTLADVLNLNWIAHYRDALGLSPEETLNYTLRHGRWITPELRRALAEQPESWLPLERTPFAALADSSDPAAAAVPWRVLAAEARRALRGYPFHIGAPLGLLLCLDLEIRDIAALLAAKRLGLASNAAFARLTTSTGA